MKTTHMSQGWIKNTARLGLLGGLSLLLCGVSGSMAQTNQTAQTTQPKQKEKKNKVPPLPEGVKLHRDQNIQGVWLADGFNFKGYQTLYLTPIVFAGVERDNEVDIRATAMQELPAELVTSLRDTKLFDTVTTKSEDVKAKSKTLRLDNTIIEFSKGSGVGRHFGGPFGGGGQPVIKVRGQIYDGDKLVCVYEIKRSGESFESRAYGEAISSEDIQRNDIRVLARDLGYFFQRHAQ
ncbi:MAG: hypothetical protein ABSG59_24425 [Verrucomicrobiota bacterium]